MNDPREKNLPKWAQDIISDLRKRIEYVREPLVAEIAKMRPQYERYKARYEAMQELIDCAAKGEHKDAQEIITIIENYDLELRKKKR